MDTAFLATYGRTVNLMIGAGTRAEVEAAVDRLVANEAWDLCGALLLSASELAARVLVARLLERQVYAPLALAASMRRQIRPPVRQQRGGGAARRVFMDIDGEAEASGVPEFIQAEQDDLSSLAAQSRDIAARREAERDADPIRILIVNELATAMVTSLDALDAVVSILKASAFDETRRSAALKIVNHPLSLRQLSNLGRCDDLVAVAGACRLDSAAQKIAELLTPHVEALIAADDRDAIWLLAKHHPDPAVREKATQAAGAR